MSACVNERSVTRGNTSGRSPTSVSQEKDSVVLSLIHDGPIGKRREQRQEGPRFRAF